MQKITIATLVAAAMLSACGGGGEVAEPAVQGGSTKALGASTYWSGISRALPTTPLGHQVAMSCHNCYGDNTAQTEAKVSKALGRGFDLVELDLTVGAT